ncbi:MAG: hypothetical protein WAL63_15950 [Solirubrobacteraceae bacterium]
MNLDFLTPQSSGAVARSPMEGMARAAGARFEARDGWNVAITYPTPAGAVSWCDASHLPKLQLQGASAAIDAVTGTVLPFSTAIRRQGAWWCRLTATRALVIGARPAVTGVDVVDVTSNFAALTVTGPQARETFARFCALDLRPRVTPVGALRPGSIGRQPGILIREDEDRYLILFGWATGEYMWSVVADAGGHLGGGPLGLDALGAVPEPEAARA